MTDHDFDIDDGYCHIHHAYCTWADEQRDAEHEAEMAAKYQAPEDYHGASFAWPR